MENQINNPQHTHNGKTIAGIVLLGLGAILLLSRLNFFFFPGWLFSWPVLLIAFGLYIGAKHNYRSTNWIFLTALGVLFLMPNIIPSLTIGLLWPVMLIAIGIHFIARRNLHWNGTNWEKRTGGTSGSNYQNFDNTAQ